MAVFKQKHGWTLGLAISIVVACSGSHKSGSSGASGDVEGYCASYCEQSHDCDESLNEQTCTNGCKNDFAALGPKLRDDFLGSVAECVKTKDCASVSSGEALADCSAETAAVLTPSSTGTAFCSELEKAVEKCDDRDFDKAACLEQAKTFNDQAIRAAQQCLDDACGDIDDCVASSLGELTGPHDGNGPDGSGARNGGGASNGGASMGGSSNSGSGGTRPTNPGGGASNGGKGGLGSGGSVTQGACTEADPSECAGPTTINTCNASGQYQVVECAELTASLGFDGSTCADDKCDPGEPLDPQCATGAGNYCACIDGGCTDEQLLGAYVACYLDDPSGTQELIRCFGSFELESAEQCAEAMACVPG